MDFLKINTAVLRQMLKLSERKEALIDELKKIEAEIFSHLNGHSKNTSVSTAKKDRPVHQKKSSKAKTDSKRAPRGMMKDQIFQALTEAGAAGIKVPELAEKIGAKSANVHVWFSNTGKTLPEIERLGAGHFRLRQNS